MQLLGDVFSLWCATATVENLNSQQAFTIFPALLLYPHTVLSPSQVISTICLCSGSLFHDVVAFGMGSWVFDAGMIWFRAGRTAFDRFEGDLVTIRGLLLLISLNLRHISLRPQTYIEFGRMSTIEDCHVRSAFAGIHCLVVPAQSYGL